MFREAYEDLKSMSTGDAAKSFGTAVGASDESNDFDSHRPIAVVSKMKTGWRERREGYVGYTSALAVRRLASTRKVRGQCRTTSPRPKARTSVCLNEGSFCEIMAGIADLKRTARLMSDEVAWGRLAAGKW